MFLAIPYRSQQLCGVRGSPLLRFFMMALALVACATGLARVTASRASNNPIAAKPEAAPSRGIQGRFELRLSAPAAVVKIGSLGAMSSAELTQFPIVGSLYLDAAGASIPLVVRWQNPSAPGEHRFAKLTFEIPGRATFSHVFDAAGDIDDLTELPFSE
jgi:hypothetical protein